MADRLTQHSETTGEQPPLAAGPLRVILLVVGTASLALGVAGIFLPVLPTTPFLLVTAACYARASTRLYSWLLGQPSLGPIVAEWRRSRSLPPGVKSRALLLVGISFGVSLVLVESDLVRLTLVVAALVLTTFLARIPTARPAPASVRMAPTASRQEPP